jgi:hypothetical protein
LGPPGNDDHACDTRNALTLFFVILSQRRIHYAEQAAKGAGPPPGAPPNLGAPSYMPLTHDEHGNPTPFGAPPRPGPPAGDPNANEFRARFHRPLLAQPPFRAYTTDGQQPPAAAPPATPTNQTANPAEAIDPHLSGGQPTAPGAAKSGYLNLAIPLAVMI